MNTWKLCTLDVWGNENDGFEVNEQFTYREAVPEAELEDMNMFLTEHLIGDPAQYTICNEYNGFIEISHTKTGTPILHLTINE